MLCIQNFFLDTFLSTILCVEPSRICVYGHIQTLEICQKSNICIRDDEKCVIKTGLKYLTSQKDSKLCQSYKHEDCRRFQHCGFHLGKCIDLGGCEMYNKDACEVASLSGVTDGQRQIKIRNCINYQIKVVFVKWNHVVNIQRRVNVIQHQIIGKYVFGQMNKRSDVIIFLLTQIINVNHNEMNVQLMAFIVSLEKLVKMSRQKQDVLLILKEITVSIIKENAKIRHVIRLLICLTIIISVLAKVLSVAKLILKSIHVHQIKVASLKQSKTAPTTYKTHQECEEWMPECTVQLFQFALTKAFLGCFKKNIDCQFYYSRHASFYIKMLQYTTKSVNMIIVQVLILIYIKPLRIGQIQKSLVNNAQLISEDKDAKIGLLVVMI
ncbi:unnamed protein product [Paramecium sonneborni]|uniref:Transmembrane protein n=1 Tax=Paramecium sonneborni TaxID=65129 RepID=A0A8S1PF54_9CILI|nr:unnamed protein product [Paramecium sonneborni]